VGRLCFALEFQHIREIDVRLTSIKFEFDGKHEQWFYPSLQAQTPEGTVDSDVTQSGALAKYVSEVDRSMLEFSSSLGEGTRVANVKFQTSYAHLTSSCLRVGLWVGSGPSESPTMKRRLSSDTNTNLEPKEEENKSPAVEQVILMDAEQQEHKPVPMDENAPLFGECYLSFPKLLGEEMTVFDMKDAMCRNRQIVDRACFRVVVHREEGAAEL
jgi:hypothetical protein